MKRRIVLLGPPASGKGTLAELIQKRCEIPATSTGAILRTEAKRGTPVGRQAAKIIATGALALDEMVMQLAAAWLDKKHGSFLFDSQCGKVISIGRHVQDGSKPCPNCGGKLEKRDDDNLGVLEFRMKEYREKTVPVTDFYDRRGIFARVDSNRSFELVFKDAGELIVG